MKINTQIKQATAMTSPVNTEETIAPTKGLASQAWQPAPAPATVTQPQEPIEYAELWKVIRGVLVVWAIAVWLLLVMMPGMDQIIDMASAMLHLPHMFIGLGLLGAIFASYSLRSDGHLLWFLGVLLLLAGWM